MLALLFISSHFTSGQAAYDDYDYAKTIAEMRAFLAEKPANAKERQRAQALIGLSHYFQRDEPRARTALRELFKENVDYALDRKMHHPDAVRFYDTERNAYLQGLSVKPAQITTTQAATPRASAPPGTLGDRQPWLRAIPGGVGHFVNEDYVAGALFLTAEVLLIGLNILGSVMRYSLQLPNGNYKRGAVEWAVVQNVGAFGAIGVAAFDILDAFIWSPKRHLNAASSR